MMVLFSLTSLRGRVAAVAIQVILLFFSSSIFAQPASTELSGLLQNLQTFQADFSQTVQDKMGRTLSQSQGTMALKRPGLFRWETQTPNQQLIIADGKTIWIYDKDLAQITKQKQSIDSNTPGLLLSDSVSHLISRFSIDKRKSAFRLIPKGKKDLFQSVQLVFDNNVLKQMILYDNLNQITAITFNNAKVNQTLSPALFRFQPPKNIEVVGE